MKICFSVKHFPASLRNPYLESKQNWLILIYSNFLWCVLCCLHHCHGSKGTLYLSSYLATSWPYIGDLIQKGKESYLAFRKLEVKCHFSYSALAHYSDWEGKAEHNLFTFRKLPFSEGLKDFIKLWWKFLVFSGPCGLSTMDFMLMHS